VDKAQFDKLQVAEKEVRDKIAKLEEDFADAQAKIDTIDVQFKQNRDAMRYMEQQRYVQDGTGKVTSYPLPPQYWDYDRANRRLEVQRKETVALLDAMRAKAQAVKGQLPVPKFSGVQLVMGPEGTPVLAPMDKGGGGAPVANLKDEIAGGSGAESSKPPVVTETPKPAADPPKAPATDKPLKY
jgi:hypothetical protein